MKARDLEALGIPRGPLMEQARSLVIEASQKGLNRTEIKETVRQLAAAPEEFTEHPLFGALARGLHEERRIGSSQRLDNRKGAPYRVWGSDLEPEALNQLKNACQLPVAVYGALMPDAHVGYGLPIGGVLATHGAVIPYAVGVDIACRMKMTVLDLPVSFLSEKKDLLAKALTSQTRFGVGAEFKHRRQHPVMDRNWNISPVTARHKDKAWSQLGTSGSGNHFVEYGTLTVESDNLGIARGVYVALLSHSGSRGTGSEVAKHYSALAQKAHRHLPRELTHLAWLDLTSSEGREYWKAMHLMGEYAAANHEIIHREIVHSLGAGVVLDVENHHNFAWKEVHFGREVIVHRKGATPAGSGVRGIIPGSMGTPGFIVEGLGNEASLCSASHGAGRVMSRSAAKQTLSWNDARKILDDRRVTLLSAGLDEVPMVYKDIYEVMAAQSDLVRVLARFDPRIVKMAPAGERAED